MLIDVKLSPLNCMTDRGVAEFESGAFPVPKAILLTIIYTYYLIIVNLWHVNNRYIVENFSLSDKLYRNI